MDNTDIECINAYLMGDANALEPLVEKYKRPLYSFILKMTEGREDTEEIFQETWFRALKNIHKFKIQKCSINTCLARMQYALGKLRSILKDEYTELREALS
jgi:hypothetical protein